MTLTAADAEAAQPNRWRDPDLRAALQVLNVEDDQESPSEEEVSETADLDDWARFSGLAALVLQEDISVDDLSGMGAGLGDLGELQAQEGGSREV